MRYEAREITEGAIKLLFDQLLDFIVCINELLRAQLDVLN